MDADRETIEANLRLHVDRLAGLIGPRTLNKPKTIEATIGNVGEATRSLATVLDALDAQRVNALVGDLGTAAQSFAETGETATAVLGDVRSVTQGVAGRSEEIEALVANAAELTSRLNDASARVDGILAEVDALLGEGGDGRSLTAELRETLDAYQALALNVNGRVAGVTDGLQRFSDQGLREVEGLIRQAQSSIVRIERAITSIEENPQRVIFGGDAVREFDGRQRR